MRKLLVYFCRLKKQLRVPTMESKKEQGAVSPRKPKLSDFPKNTESPYDESLIQQLSPTQRRRIVTPTNKEVLQTVSSTSTGEIIGQSVFMDIKEVDNEEFIKFFVSNFKAFWDLSKPATRVFTYIMHNVKPNKNTFTFILEDCMEYCQYKSKKDVFQGLADLCAKEIIARGRTQWQYFINPVITFNGDRLIFAKGVIRNKIKRQANEEQLSLWGNVDNAGLTRLRQMNNQLEDENGSEPNE